MARVILQGSLQGKAGGGEVLDLDVTNVYQLFGALAARYPELAPVLEHEVAVSIDNEIFQDALLAPIGPASEVILIPKIAGG